MNEFHGLFLVNKRSGVTSHDVVAQARRILKTRTVGHCGTLDPLAEGLLILVVGEATKMSQYILEGDKSYLLEMILGLTTDTLDTTGQILEQKEVTVSEQQIQTALQSFIGEKEWQVPLYSAVKVNGQKLYDYGRNEQKVERPMKKMKFWNVEFQNRDDKKLKFHLYCSKGSYIRTWVDELGKSLGCGSAMSFLRRTTSAPYDLSQAQSLEEIEADLNAGLIPRSFLSIVDSWSPSLVMRIKGHDEKLMKNGQISHDLKLRLIQCFQPEQAGATFLVQSSANERPLALIGLEPNKGFVIRRVFHFTHIG
jgi:tRNA pseudouridine55 synthase